MPVSESINQKLNEQITNELFASQSYLAMSCYFDTQGLIHMGRLFRAQADEERAHAMKILDYLLEVDGRVSLQSIDAPKHTFESVVEAAETALQQETQVTSQIHALVTLADSEKDYATRSFLQWFVDEQVEETATMSQLVQLARMAGPNLLHLDTYVSRLREGGAGSTAT